MIIDAIDTELQNAATEAELKRKGAGLACIVPTTYDAPGIAANHSSTGWGVIKSLGHRRRGPVVLVHTRKAGIKYKKPTSPNSWYPRDIGLAISAHSAPSV